MKLNRKSFHCEHFLKCVRVILDTTEENAVNLQVIRLDLIGGFDFLFSFSSTASQPKELTQHVEGDRIVPLRMQNEYCTVNTIQLFSDEQGSVNTY